MKSASELIAELDKCTTHIQDQNKELNSDQLNYKPFGNAWSVLEVIEHITILDTLVFENILPRLEKTNGKPAKPEKFGWFERWFMKYINPDSRLKIKAPKMYKPPATSFLDADITFSKFEDHQSQFKSIITFAENCDQRQKVRSPFTVFLRLSIAAWIHLGVMHQQRHILQIEKIRKKIAEVGI